MWFNPSKAEERIAYAQQRMNTAPSEALTRYWFRIWRARRRTYNVWQRKMRDQLKNLGSIVS